MYIFFTSHFEFEMCETLETHDKFCYPLFKPHIRDHIHTTHILGIR